VLAALCLLVATKIVGDNKKTVKQLDSVSPPPAEPVYIGENYSRITFFNTMDSRASLAIPDYWEGKYRLEEVGQQARFYYIGDSEKTIELFTISVHHGDRINIGEAEKLITEKSRSIFTYKRGGIDRSEDADKDLQQMMNDIESVVATIRVY
jgi:hypothetical protein